MPWHSNSTRELLVPFELNAKTTSFRGCLRSLSDGEFRRREIRSESRSKSPRYSSGRRGLVRQRNFQSFESGLRPTQRIWCQP